ncbi:hypothetical protein ACXO2X_08435, partial [Lactobacillus delbrueckii subsp. bulgaricus]
LLNAESSWWETACEDRKLPRETRGRRKSGSFCFPWLLYFFKHRHHRKQAATMGLLTLIIGLVMLVNPTLATETATSVE